MNRFALVVAVMVSVAGCGTNPDGLNLNGSPDSGMADVSRDAKIAPSPDATGASLPPTLKPGVDTSIFLPKIVAGYHPTPEELATSGKACSSDADCATSGGQVVFRCSTPYYGQAQCQGSFPPGDQTVPGMTPSCAHYNCPAGYECEAEAESHSVTCLQGQHSGKSAP
jgi:hypothetical protein